MTAAVFHLSFAVPDLAAARTFYTTVLECTLGRDEGTWIDLLFCGHQLTVHQESTHHPAVALDHFGVVIGKASWTRLLERCRAHGAGFALEPLVRDAGTATEAGKFIVPDPAGNLVEIKYYEDFGKTVARDGR